MKLNKDIETIQNIIRIFKMNNKINDTSKINDSKINNTSSKINETINSNDKTDQTDQTDQIKKNDIIEKKDVVNPVNEDQVLTHVLDRKYDNNTIDFKYICIKKEHFDVGMIYLKYTNLKKENYIEIIYKSPSIHLDGLFFKTPVLKSLQLAVSIKDKGNFTSAYIQCILNKNENADFINMMKSIDTYISAYIARHARDINFKMQGVSSINIDDKNNEYHYLNYENIIKPHYSKQSGNLSYSIVAGSGLEVMEYNNKNKFATNASRSDKRWLGDYEIVFKSYIDRKLLDTIRQELVSANKKYIITFNISNLYFGKTGIVPLIKCNKCDEL
jgi:hypothetical protein